jgi:hypothetical protein
MIHLNDEQMIREPNLEGPEGIGMLQDSELDLVVGGFLGTAIQNAKSRSGKVTHNDISITKYIDAATP